MTVYNLDITFPILNQFFVPCLVPTVASWNHIHRFLRRLVRQYSHIFKNFPQFVLIHIVKGFSIVNEEVDVFLELSCFLYGPRNVGSLVSGSSAFSRPSLYIWKFQFTYCWNLAWRILSINLLACEMHTVVWKLEHFLALPFFGIGVKN